jgi:hypothetical protein
MTSWDTPYMTDTGASTAPFNASEWAGLITRMDVRFDARLYLVWVFEDNTVYTLGSVDWRVVFRASTPPEGQLTIDPASIITASPAVRTNADPVRVTGSIYNDVVYWNPWPD